MARLAWAAFLTTAGPAVAQADETVNFNQHVRPILQDKCLHCHGPDATARQAELRLDRQDEAHAPRDGRRVIVPGRPEQSELIRRITTGGDERMPPADQRRQLTASEIELLRRWVAQGGRYEQHWAFVPPSQPVVPTVGDAGWPINAIDHFVWHRLQQHGLRPAPPASRETLIRRVTLDLTGLPPTPGEVDAFLADEAPGAYDRLVDRLLTSPPYGERMALVWLDAARYADSGGYQGDILRSMWLWRDWVIAAYNQGLPFDQFTIEQLAGDLLPEPTREQRIATGFNRNHRINDEDGIIHEEFRVEYVVDRVETTATVWMGLTMGCARCHDHKYDPISQREFYRFFAYFNSIDESGRGRGNAPPLLPVATGELAARIAAAETRLSELQRQLKAAANGDGKAAAALRQELDKAAKALDALRKQVPTTMVMKELEEPRETFVLIRGAYDRRGEQVAHGTPAVLGGAAGAQTPQAVTPPQQPANRLGLARWLLSPSHPLTARVAVNRYWLMYFGRGLVETPEDFGTQGALPTHRELLDWLATEFANSGWDVKALQRRIVTSATYRQASQGSGELLQLDPDNRLLARGPRFRLPAEAIRDQALAASGLLTRRIGGPSVRPYQPDGLWTELASASSKYAQGQGAALYRRSLYTFVRRTVPPPAMTVLDAPNRETCLMRRPRTNTPLQALTLMNDPTYVEAARVLAEQTLGTSPGRREAITAAFRRLLARRPAKAELASLEQAWGLYHRRYVGDLDAAKRLLSVGESRPDDTLDPAEAAAHTAICLLLLNLDETITKE